MSVVAAPADKRFRRAHVKPSRRRPTWWARARPAVVYAVLAALAVVVFFQGGAILARAHVLHIDHIAVRGNVRVTTDSVLAALDGLEGQSLMQADLEAWRLELLASSWIKDATLRRVLPSTVEVTISERAPVVIGRLKGKLMLVGGDGVLIDSFGPVHAGLDLPIVDGLDVSGLEVGAQADAVRTALVSRVLADVQADAEVATRVSQIDVADVHNVRVTLDGDAAVLHIGDAAFLARIRSYVQLAPTLRANVPDIEYVDLRFGERIYVGPATRASAPVVTTARSPQSGRSQRGRARE